MRTRRDGKVALTLRVYSALVSKTLYASFMRSKTYLNYEEQWRRTVRQYVASNGNKRIGQEAKDPHAIMIGQCVGGHRLFVLGDFVISEALYIEGNDRQPVWSESSKGYRAKFYYMHWTGPYSPHALQNKLFHHRHGEVMMLEVPEALVQLKLDSDEVMEWAVQLRSKQLRPGLVDLQVDLSI
jgi:hypothetical protein